MYILDSTWKVKGIPASFVSILRFHSPIMQFGLGVINTVIMFSVMSLATAVHEESVPSEGKLEGKSLPLLIEVARGTMISVFFEKLGTFTSDVSWPLDMSTQVINSIPCYIRCG